MKQETEVHVLVGTVILGFLSIFKRRKASSPFEALNSVCLSKYQNDMIPTVNMRRRHTAFSRVSTGDSDILHLVTWNTSLNLSHCREILHSFESGLSQYIPVETESTESLSPTYCWGKLPLEVLVESWLKSSIKDRESALNLGRYVVHGAFLELLYWY